MNTGSFCSRMPARQKVLPEDRLGTDSNGTFKTVVAVRPARLAFYGSPRPRTDDLVWQVWTIYTRDDDRSAPRKAIHTPFVYRGQVDGHAAPGDHVRVSLSEEPSGRPLLAELPWEWFTKANLEPYKGFPFRLVTWMVEKDDRTLEPRCWIESLLPMKSSMVAP